MRSALHWIAAKAARPLGLELISAYDLSVLRVDAKMWREREWERRLDVETIGVCLRSYAASLRAQAASMPATDSARDLALQEARRVEGQLRSLREVDAAPAV